jgi:hypothetical protein
MLRTTYTYAVLEVSKEAYKEIMDKLITAGYGHVFHKDSDGGTVIDMHGIALGVAPCPKKKS